MKMTIMMVNERIQIMIPPTSPIGRIWSPGHRPISVNNASHLYFTDIVTRNAPVPQHRQPQVRQVAGQQPHRKRKPQLM